MKQTILHSEHKALGAKLIDFNGWHLPASYAGVLAEHKCVREQGGLFDVSHMGEIFIKGPEAAKFLQFAAMNDVERLQPGAGQYTAILNEKGGFVDDLILYQISSDEFLACVNAGNIAKDFDWLRGIARDFDVEVRNESADWSQIALQGPHSLAAMQRLLSGETANRFSALPYMGFMQTNLSGSQVYLARTGYTGEKGVELYIPNSVAVDIWRGLLKAGEEFGIKPIGLGARDTLRLEAGYLLYGNDMNESVSPLEAGVGWAVALAKGSFMGSEALKQQKEAGAPRLMRCLRMEEKGIPRSEMKVLLNGRHVGQVTSGSQLPTVGYAGGMALIERGIKIGDKVEVDVRGKTRVACIVKRPFYAAKVHEP